MKARITMADLIDRQKLLKKKQYSFQTENGAFPRHDYFIKISDIRSMSAVDIEQHAHWIIKYDMGEPVGAICSNCESEIGYDRNGYSSEMDELYCHNCGCKMDEVVE